MKLPLALDPHSKTPMYAQIVEQVEGLIKKGFLHPGDRLPPERELARLLVVARGTVKRAYELLESRQLVEGTQGRGTFIARAQVDHLQDRRERALGALSRALDTCEDLAFSHGEILTWCQLLLRQRSEIRATIHALAFDCNPEALVSLTRQMQEQLGISIHGKLLSELEQDVFPVRTCEPYDLILIPVTHFSEMASMLEPLRGRLTQVALAPSYQTVARTGALSGKLRVAVCARSEEFFRIVCHWVKQLASLETPPVRKTPADLEKGEKTDFDVLIMPPENPVEPSGTLVKRMTMEGVQVFPFEYQVEQGSIIHLQSLIKHIVQQRLES